MVKDKQDERDDVCHSQPHPRLKIHCFNVPVIRRVCHVEVEEEMVNVPEICEIKIFARCKEQPPSSTTQDINNSTQSVTIDMNPMSCAFRSRQAPSHVRGRIDGFMITVRKAFSDEPSLDVAAKRRFSDLA